MSLDEKDALEINTRHIASPGAPVSLKGLGNPPHKTVKIKQAAGVRRNAIFGFLSPRHDTPSLPRSTTPRRMLPSQYSSPSRSHLGSFSGASSSMARPLHTPSSSLGRISSKHSGSSNESTNQSRVRMAGRGGSGSQPRFIANSTPSLNTLVSGRSSSTGNTGSGNLRIVGRGGSGSQQRKPSEKDLKGKAKAPWTRPPPLSQPTDLGAAHATRVAPVAKVVRVQGRGGAASRPRVVPDHAGTSGGGSGSIVAKLTWMKSKNAAGKAMEMTAPQRSPASRLSWTRQRLSIESMETVSTMQFGPPDESELRRTKNQSNGSQEDLEMPSFPIAPTSKRNALGGAIRNPLRTNNFSKIAKTMGELPPHLLYQQLMNEQHPQQTSSPPILKVNTQGITSISSDSIGSFATADSTDSDPMRTPSSSRPTRRRSSISYAMTSLPPSSSSSSSLAAPASSIFRSSSASSSSSKPNNDSAARANGRRGSVAVSQRTTSTAGGGLHQFALADDLSDTWGEVRDDDDGECRRGNPSSESPITFGPPTPVATTAPSGNNGRQLYRLSDTMASVASSESVSSGLDTLASHGGEDCGVSQGRGAAGVSQISVRSDAGDIQLQERQRRGAVAEGEYSHAPMQLWPAPEGIVAKTEALLRAISPAPSASNLSSPQWPSSASTASSSSLPVFVVVQKQLSSDQLRPNKHSIDSLSTTESLPLDTGTLDSGEYPWPPAGGPFSHYSPASARPSIANGSSSVPGTPAQAGFGKHGPDADVALANETSSIGGTSVSSGGSSRVGPIAAAWTGEWNTELPKVIKALRELR